MTDQPFSADELLDGLIHAIIARPAPVAAREQAIARAVASHASRQSEESEAKHHRFRLYEWRWAIAAMLLIAVGVALLLPTVERARMQRSPMIASSGMTPAAETPRQLDQQANAAYKLRTNAQTLVAQRAPILIANGPATPLNLGSETSSNQNAGALHIWNWSKSATSQIVPGIELWSSDHVALSPDGSTLSCADGTIHFLPGENLRPANLPKMIDLGGADYHEGASTYTRIGDMQFSPDGQRLALLVTLRNADQTVREVIQIVEFPSGKRLCEFPAGEAYALRIAFSADGKQIAAGSPDRHVILRDGATGEAIRQFEPAFKSQILAIAFSTDGRHIAASAREGQIICFDPSSGKIAWQTDNDHLGRCAVKRRGRSSRLLPG